MGYSCCMTNFPRIGSNRGRRETNRTSRKRRCLVRVLLEMTALRSRRDPPSNIFTPRTTRRCVIPLVPSVRRNSSRRGQRMCKTGYGRMRSRLGVACTTRVAMPKSPRMGLLQPVGGRRRDELEPLIRCWANARQRSVMPRKAARLLSSTNHHCRERSLPANMCGSKPSLCDGV